MRPNKVEYFRRPDRKPFKNPQKRKQPFPAIEDNKQPFPAIEDWAGTGWIDYSGGGGAENTGGTGGNGTGDGIEYTGGSGSEHQGGNYDDHPGNWRRKKHNKGQKRVLWWQQHKDRTNYAGGAASSNSYINVPPKAKEASQPPVAAVHAVAFPPPDSDMEVEVGTDGAGAIPGSSFPPIPPGMPGINGFANPMITCALLVQGKQYVLTCIT